MRLATTFSTTRTSRHLTSSVCREERLPLRTVGPRAEQVPFDLKCGIIKERSRELFLFLSFQRLPVSTILRLSRLTGLGTGTALPEASIPKSSATKAYTIVQRRLYLYYSCISFCRYTCGDGRLFKAANGTKYEKVSTTCQWDSTWSWIRRDRCSCE